MQYLPVKSVIRAACVSRELLSSLKSPGFITTHTSLRNSRPHQLIVQRSSYDTFDRCIVLMDSSGIIHRGDDLQIPHALLPYSVDPVWNSSHGLIGLHRRESFYLWNPSLRLYKRISMQAISRDHVTFGVNPKNLDPKIIMCPESYDGNEITVLTLSLEELIEIEKPTNVRVNWGTARTTDTHVYWIGVRVDRVLDDASVLLSFNLETNEFGVVYLPFPEDGTVRLYTVSGSLRVAFTMTGTDTVTIWAYEDNEFTLLLNCYTRVLCGLTITNMPIVQAFAYADFLPTSSELAVYEPGSQPGAQQYHRLDIFGRKDEFLVTPYTESLLLFDNPYAISY